MNDAKIILVIEDDPDDRFLIERALRKQSPEPEIVFATNKSELKEAVTDGGFDLVVTDYKLGWTTGAQTVDRMKRNMPGVPIIMFTGSVDEADAVELMKKGLDDYIIKSTKGYDQLGKSVVLTLDKAEVQKKEEEAIRKVQESAHQWQLTFDAISDGVAIIDNQDIIIKCNKAMGVLLDMELEEIIGRKCFNVVHGTEGPYEGCPILKMRESNKRESMVFEMNGRRLEVTVDPIIDSEGKMCSAVHIIKDISER